MFIALFHQMKIKNIWYQYSEKTKKENPGIKAIPAAVGSPFIFLLYPQSTSCE
jgi:hypothetical protein